MLKGKVAVVTGAGRGIGKAIALKLAENGADIVINDVPGSDYADDTKKEIEALGVRAIVVRGDVRNPSDVENTVNTAKDTFGGIDIWVNNAGVTRDGLMLRMSEEDWDLYLYRRWQRQITGSDWKSGTGSGRRQEGRYYSVPEGKGTGGFRFFTQNGAGDQAVPFREIGR